MAGCATRETAGEQTGAWVLYFMSFFSSLDVNNLTHALRYGGGIRDAPPSRSNSFYFHAVLVAKLAKR